MELIVLGAGSILPRPGYGCAGYVVRSASGPVTLLDCGPGSVRALGAVGLGVEDVGRVVFSHYHPDHCLDLLALLFARRNPDLEQVPPLELVGPKGVRRLLDGGRVMYGGWVEPGDVTVSEIGVEVPTRADGSVELERDGLRLRAVRTLHTPDALAWRIDGPDGSLTYSGDSPETDAVGDLARGCDLFVCECSFADAEAVDGHLTPSSAARLARRAACGTLLLTHFYPGLDPEDAVAVATELAGCPVRAAHDGLRVPLRA